MLTRPPNNQVEGTGRFCTAWQLHSILTRFSASVTIEDLRYLFIENNDSPADSPTWLD